MKTAKQLYKLEKATISELYNLGLLTHVEMLSQNIRNKYLYKTQLADSQ